MNATFWIIDGSRQLNAKPLLRVAVVSCLTCFFAFDASPIAFGATFMGRDEALKTLDDGVTSGDNALQNSAANQIGENGKIYVAPLFEYPEAPYELVTLGEKSDYLISHFWDGMNFTNTAAVDQNALNHAFSTYAGLMPFASRNVVLGSVRDVIKKLKGNPVLTFQFCKAAEEALYGPRSDMWSDEVYIPFLKAIGAEKGVSDARKARYASQLNKIERSLPGKKFPQLRLTRQDSRQFEYKPDKALTLIEFGDPDCEDCQYAKLKLEMASDIADAIHDGKMDMVFIVPDAVPEDEPELLKQLIVFNNDWIKGVSYSASDILDIRSTPSFYVVGAKGEIIAKNLSVYDAVDAVREQLLKK